MDNFLHPAFQFQQFYMYHDQYPCNPVQTLHLDKVYIKSYIKLIMTQMMSIKDTRDNLAEVINKVYATGAVVVVTKFGKPKVMIVPVTDDKLNVSAGLDESFGAWKGREDIEDSSKWVANIRTKMSVRPE